MCYYAEAQCGDDIFVSGDSNLFTVYRKITFQDYLSLEANFGKTGDWRIGDMNGDGKVSFADYLVLESAYGKLVAAPSRRVSAC